MLLVIARLTLREEGVDAYLDAAREAVAPTRAEPGCLGFELTRSLEHPATVVFVERWTDRPALDAHLASPHIAAFGAVATPLTTEATVTIHHVERVEDLA